MCFTKAEIILRHVHRFYVDYVAFYSIPKKARFFEVNTIWDKLWMHYNCSMTYKY